MSKYIADVDTLATTTQLKHIQTPILESPTPRHTKQQVVIKFNHRWGTITMKNLQEVLHYFEEIRIDLINFECSSKVVCVTLSISKPDINSFIRLAMDACKKLLKSIGVLEITTPDKNYSFRREDDNNFDGTLIEYVEVGDTFVTQLLLQLGANPNNKSEKGITALKLAMDHKRPEMIKILLTGGADGLSALILASQNGNEEEVKLLIEARVNINLQNKDGITGLIAATQYNREKVVELLLKQKDINVDSADKNGYTALHYACRMGSKVIVNCLLQKKADIHLYTRNGSTPLKLVAEYENQDLINVLASTGEIKESEKMDAISVARTSTMKRLLALTCTQSQDESRTYTQSQDESHTYTR